MNNDLRTTLPADLIPSYLQFAEQAKELYGASISARFYLAIMEWMEDLDTYSRSVRWIRKMGETQALWAIKLNDEFIPILSFRERRAPIAALPMATLDKYMPTLRYECAKAQRFYIITGRALGRLYGVRNLTFEAYVEMCETCRIGRVERKKITLREKPALVCQIRQYFRAARDFPETVYAIWNNEAKLVEGCISRGEAARLSAPSRR